MKKMICMIAMMLMAFSLQARNECVNNVPASVSDPVDEWLDKTYVFKTRVYQGDEYEAEIIVYEKKNHVYSVCFTFYAEAYGDADDEIGWFYHGKMIGIEDSGSLVLIIPEYGIEDVGGCPYDNDFMPGDFIRIEKEGNKYKGIPLGHGRNSIDASSINITVSPKPKDFEVPNYATSNNAVRE